MCIRDRIYAGGGNCDTHNNIQGQLPDLCHYIDHGMSALLTDLEQRGMLSYASDFGDCRNVGGTIRSSSHWTVSYTHLDVYKRQG